MNKMTKKIIGVLVLVVFFVASVFVGNGVNAASTDEIYEKVLVNNIARCYEVSLVSDIGVRSYFGFGTLMNQGYKDASASDAIYSFYIPSIVGGNTISSDGQRMSCYESFVGRKKGWLDFSGQVELNGVLDVYGGGSIPDDNNNVDKLNSFMTDKMNYSVVAGENNTGKDYCYTVYLQETVATTEELSKACVSQDSYPLGFSTGTISFSSSSNPGYVVTGGLTSDNDEENPEYRLDVTVTKNGATCYDISDEDTGKKAKCSATKSFGAEDPSSSLNKDMSLSPSVAIWDDRPNIYVRITEEDGGTNSKGNSYKKDKSGDEFIKNLTGKDPSEFAISDADKYSLYVTYLKEFFGVSDTSLNGGSCQADKPTQLVNAEENKYYVFVNGSGWCLAGVSPNKVNSQANMTVFASGGGSVLTNVITTLPELIEKMGELNYDDPSMFPDIDNAGTVDQQGTKEETDKCFENAGALGWVLCPITSGIANLGSSAYNWIEENFLQVKASIFTESNNGVQDAWGTIRNIANVGFIIMLLVVVFSQITGVGIDNYGIKRILPRIIIGAIIMNLSYIICELMIDVSNIFGSGLNDLLSNLGPGFSESAGVKDPSFAQYLIVGGAGVLATAGYLILTSGGLGAVLMLFIAALTVVISILVLFVILIIRQAGIVICVVVAPIAVLCYLLPNTEKVFKRWWELMKGLLLVYPLCGLLIGAGGFIGKVFGNLAVSGSGDMQMGFALSAMVVQAIPYLFIPMLLRSSLAAMGNLGARISGFGNRISGGINRGIRNSGAMRNSQELATERRNRFRAGIDRNGEQVEVGALGRFIRGGRRGMARARTQYLKDQDNRIREDNLMGVGFEASSAAVRAKADEDKVKAYGSLLELGEATTADGRRVNTNDAASIGAYHAEAMERYEVAENDDERAEAMAQIKAAQNVLSKTDKGRAAIQDNFESAIQNGHTRAITPAAAHVMGAYGDRFKAVNRGAHAMLSDLSTGVNMDDVRNKINDKTYDRAGTSKYTEESLAGADDAALDRLISSMGSMSAEERANIQGTAYRALQKSQNGNLNVKPEVAGQLRRIAEGYNNGEPTEQVIDVRTPENNGGGQTIDVRALGDETLLDIATNPNAEMGDATRTAAEQEYLRRNPGGNGNPPQNPPQNTT